MNAELTPPRAPRFPGLARATTTVKADRSGLIVLGGLGIAFGLGYAVSGAVPIDLPWKADLGHLYGQTWGVDAESRYVYPPILAQAIGLIRALGQPGAVFLWTASLFIAAWIAYRAWSLPVLVMGLPAFVVGFWWPLAAPILYPIIGNIQPAIAAVCILGLRWPGLWAFSILTKIGPGIGILWFAFRGEWRSVAIALGTSAAVALISVIAAPGAWADFVDFAIHNAGAAAPVPTVPVPLVVRLPMAIALLAWGAPRGHRWTVPLAVGWSALALYEWSYLAIWAAALPMADWADVRGRLRALR